MESSQGRHFSITERKDVNTVIYQVNKSSKQEIMEGAPKFSAERLEFYEELREDKLRKTFFVDRPKPQGNQLLFLSFSDNKVVINMGILQNDRVKISKKPIPVKFDTVYSEEGTLFKDFNYTPNFKRPIFIIDPATAEEIKPEELYFDKETNKVRGKIVLQPKKPYFAFEIREDKK